MSKWFLIFLLVFYNTALHAQCEADEYELQIDIQTDDYGFETSWELFDQLGNLIESVPILTYDDNSTYQELVCVPQSSCVLFVIYDDFGDGGATYDISIAATGESYSGGGDYGKETQQSINCSLGSNCQNAEDLGLGQHQSPNAADYWFAFKASQLGSYTISSCDNNCDTRLWIYDDCDVVFQQDITGTIYYNDNNSLCDLRAHITQALLDPSKTYLGRIGTVDQSCAGSISFTISYDGPIAGCTDPDACNYNPLATIENGSCIAQSSSECPEGPDLSVNQSVLETTIFLDTYDNADPCMIDEGCIAGYGLRDIIRFETEFSNIGETDYLVGKPEVNPNQFTYDNCHQHYHYDGYAEYLLYDASGQSIPAGFKNGFCLTDLVCDSGINGKFGCDYMGLSAGCTDIYESYLDCQWLDVTDVPDGNYTLAVRVNWDNAPDAFGRTEKNRTNNWAQVCIILDRSSGSLKMERNSNCPDFTDCNGTPYGNAVPDCLGDCGGMRIMGDIDETQVLDNDDVLTYLAELTFGVIQANPCNDINRDDKLSVYDAALISSCLQFGSAHPHDGSAIHDHCEFPQGVLNINQSNYLSLISHNETEKYFDIGLRNPGSAIVAFQFELEGLVLAFPVQLELLVDGFSAQLRSGFDQALVVALNMEDASISKSTEVQELIRVYYSHFTDAQVCLAASAECINHEYEQTIVEIEGDCFDVDWSTIDNIDSEIVTIQPNPFTEVAKMDIPDHLGEYQIRIYDLSGRRYKQAESTFSLTEKIQKQDLGPGVFIFELQFERQIIRGQFVIF